MAIVCPEGNERWIRTGPIILIISGSRTPAGLTTPAKYLIAFDNRAAITEATIAATTISGFLMKRSISVAAGNAFPKNVRFDHKNGPDAAEEELICKNRDLFAPHKRRRKRRVRKNPDR